jgi:hypothetical protein
VKLINTCVSIRDRRYCKKSVPSRTVYRSDRLYTVPYRTAQKILHTVPYRYRRGFAVYRLAKYRCTAKIFLRVSKLESTHYYIYTQPELPVGNYNEGKDTEKLSLLVKLSTFLPQNA